MIANVAFAWSIDRASGIAALLLASATIVVGLMRSSRDRADRRLPAIEAHALHEALSIGVLVAIAVHVLAFAIDPFFNSGLVAALVPFDSPYRAFAVGLGQIAAYGLVALSVTYYARRSFGVVRWRAAHRFIPVFWGVAIFHTLLAGTDVATWWFLLATIPPVFAALVLVLERWDTRSAATDAALAPSGPPSARNG